MVGDFHSFQGQPEEVQAMKFAKRAVVKQLTMTHLRGWVGHTVGEFLSVFLETAFSVSLKKLIWH